ncbi:hypothetical protein [Pontixanthobacter aquaemixtae]|uniref:Uncharacterized protein n=1 Tax=Pontixanthobacter aquaemixtae TaxID=1958940 RepID=A0A844ZU86_9SPHN|nr:hypothetical protein [Pontixanthobacter aquaemixtae]MXO90842.1 hypothetical protein [Pontixanthobacter aquaemixtae]
MTALAELAAWRDIVLDGEGGAIATIRLSQHEAEIMRDLALGDSNPLQIELELAMPGIVGGLPFIAELQTEAVHGLLSAQFGANPADENEIKAAFQSIPKAMLSFRRNGSGRNPGDDALRNELAQRAIYAMFEPSSEVPGQYTFGELPPQSPLSIRLDLPRRDQHITRVSWSFREFVASLENDDAIARHFPQRDDIRPFDTVEISALNQVPLDSSHVQRLRVDLEFTGRTGTPVHETIEFRPGDPLIKRISATWPSLTHRFEMRSKLTAFVTQPVGFRGPAFAWPDPAQFSDAADPLAIDLSSSRLGLAMTEIRALDGLFDLCASCTYRLNFGPREFEGTLDPSRMRGFVMYPAGGPVPNVTIVAHPIDPSHSDVIVHDGPPEGGQVLISPLEAQRREPLWVEAQIADPEIPYAVIEIRSSEGARITTRIVRPGQPARIARWPSLFAPLAYEHRLSVVRRDAEGRTKPIETEEWTPGTAPVLTIN